MSTSSAIIAAHLRVTLTPEYPGLSLGASLQAISPKDSGEYLQQRELFSILIIKLKERQPSAPSNDPVEQQAQAIFDIAMLRMQEAAPDQKQLKENRMALALAFEQHKNEQLFRSCVTTVIKEKEVLDLAADFARQMTLEPKNEQLFQSRAIKVAEEKEVKEVAADLPPQPTFEPKKVRGHVRSSGSVRLGTDFDGFERVIDGYERVKRASASSPRITELGQLFVPPIPPVASPLALQHPSSSSSDEDPAALPEVASSSQSPEDVLRAKEQQERLIIKTLSYDELRDYLVYWRDEGPNPFLPKPALDSKEAVPEPPPDSKEAVRLKALPIEKRLSAPLRRLVCQEQVIRRICQLPKEPELPTEPNVEKQVRTLSGAGAHDWERSLALSRITIAGQALNKWDHSKKGRNTAQYDFTMTTNRFREILKDFLEKLPSKSEAKAVILSKWDEIVAAIIKKHTPDENFPDKNSFDENSPVEPFEAFFLYLYAKVELDFVAQQLLFLLRTSIQETYREPGNAVSNIFHKLYQASTISDSISIEYAFGDEKITVRVRSTQEFKEIEERKSFWGIVKKPKVFSVIMQNTLTAPLADLSTMNSEILLEIPSGPKAKFLEGSVFTPLLQGGFFATYS